MQRLYDSDEGPDNNKGKSELDSEEAVSSEAASVADSALYQSESEDIAANLESDGLQPCDSEQEKQ